jgi:hypothetical protein
MSSRQEFQAATTSLVAGWHMGLLVASNTSGGGAAVSGTGSSTQVQDLDSSTIARVSSTEGTGRSPPTSPSRLQQQGQGGEGTSPPRSPTTQSAGGARVSPSRLGSSPPGTGSTTPVSAVQAHHARSGSMSRLGSGTGRGGGGRMPRLRMGTGSGATTGQGSLSQYGSGTMQATSSPTGVVCRSLRAPVDCRFCRTNCSLTEMTTIAHPSF